MSTENTYNSDPRKHGEMAPEELFLMRLQLLIVMAKAFLKGYPLGEFRRKAILDNSEAVFYMSLHFNRVAVMVPESSSGSENAVDGRISSNHLLHQRIQLLAIMTKAIAEDRLIGEYKRKALMENVDAICRAVTFKGQWSDADFLKVA